MLTGRRFQPLERLPDRPTLRRSAPETTSRRSQGLATLGRAVLLSTVVAVIGAVSLAEDLALTRPLVDAGAAAQVVVAEQVDVVEQGWRKHLETASLADELHDLEREHARLQLELGRLRAIEREHQALLGTLDLRSRIGAERGVAARVVAQGTGPRQTVRLDVGLEKGVREGHVALAAEGVLGQVVRAGDGWSDVLALTDPSAGVHGVLADSGARSSLTGDGTQLRMTRVALRADEVRMGEWVYTSGMGGVFPEGMPLGSVVSVRTDPDGPFLELTLAPLARAERAQAVWVVDAARPQVLAGR